MKEERTAGPLHSAHSMQLHSPHHAARRPHPRLTPPLFYRFHSPPVYALLAAPRGVCPAPSTRGSSRLCGLRLGPGRTMCCSRAPEFSPPPPPPASTPRLSLLHSSPRLSSRGPLSATLACFVNNHLFVAGMAAAITSDLPVSSIMDRLLDVNICKSLLLDSPPGRD